MGNGSEEQTVEEELAALEEQTDDSTDADLAALEAELDDEGALGEGDVGLDTDPSDQYAELLDDTSARGGGGAGGRAGPDADTDDSGGSLLGGRFGRAGDDTADSSAPPDTATSVDDLLGDRTGNSEATGGDKSRGLRARAARYVSLRWFLGALVAMVLFAGVGRTFVPLVGGPLGLATGAFLVGLVSAGRRYLEILVAGVVLGGLATLAGSATVAFATGSVLRITAVGAGGGLVVSLVGAYFGRDLRGGLVGGSGNGSEDGMP